MMFHLLKCPYWTQSKFFLKKWASPGLFFYFRSFLVTISILQIEKSIDGVLGIRTRGRRVVGADETTELWRPPTRSKVIFDISFTNVLCHSSSPYKRTFAV